MSPIWKKRVYWSRFFLAVKNQNNDAKFNKANLPNSHRFSGANVDKLNGGGAWGIVIFPHERDEFHQ